MKIAFNGDNGLNFYPAESKNWTLGYKLFYDRQTAKRWDSAITKAKHDGEILRQKLNKKIGNDSSMKED